MSTTKASPTLREQTRRGAGIQLPRDLAQPLQDFGKRCGLSGAHVARMGLAFVLPRLLNGEFEIVNGELRSTGKSA